MTLALLILIVTALCLYLWLGLPATLRTFGLHARYRGPHYSPPGKRALIVTTSQATLEPGTKATGVFGSELTAPYYAFFDAAMAVEISASWAARFRPRRSTRNVNCAHLWPSHHISRLDRGSTS